jgi:murein L,D-transpeptidase YafK
MIRFLTALPIAAILCAILTAAPMAQGRTADLVVIFKGERLMELYGGGDLLNRYRVSLGWAPAGAKRRQGDGRTPEGLYTINRHNPNSNYHLSLGISYPGPEDIGNAILLGVPAGGQVMIHGYPNRVKGVKGDPGDWTDGCIAVNNHEIEEIYAAVPDGTPVMILP